MGVINHTLGAGLLAGGGLSALFATHAVAPQMTGMFTAAGAAYPLQGVGLISSLTSTLAVMNPWMLGAIAVGTLMLGMSVMKSDHPSPSHK